MDEARDNTVRVGVLTVSKAMVNKVVPKDSEKTPHRKVQYCNGIFYPSMHNIPDLLTKICKNLGNWNFHTLHTQYSAYLLWNIPRFVLLLEKISFANVEIYVSSLRNIVYLMCGILRMSTENIVPVIAEYSEPLMYSFQLYAS